MLSNFSRSLGWALSGIFYALKNEPHMRFHLLGTFGAVLVGLWLGLTASEWLHIIFAVALVWVAELINTAVECVVDLYTAEYHPLAKTAKDVAAGAVLVTAINSLVVAGLVFVPKIFN
ncbi:MAG: diacylglycerol kinase family protein [Firmicutes bacterium]|nr:diacylglycerol kinase family protein [Bacillota bacterium]